MNDESFTIRVPKRWARIALIVVATSLIVAPLTAVATHSFDDVPNSHTFHGSIEWMRQSGVTQGCNPPANDEYCPDENVTRGQMAAFMTRFAGYLGAKDGTPAQADNASSADTLDGKSADDLTVVAAADIDTDLAETTVAEVTTINEVEIIAPKAGILIINGSAHVGTSVTATASIKPYVNGNAAGAYGSFDHMTAADDDQDQFDNLSYTTAVEVPAGTHAVRQDVGQILLPDGLFADAPLEYNANNLTVMFIPMGTVTVAGTGGG